VSSSPSPPPSPISHRTRRKNKRRSAPFEISQCASVRFFVALLAILAFSSGIVQRHAQAGFASRLTLTLGEEFNDNIFFSPRPQHDFITYLNPTLSLYYVPPAQTTPVFDANFTPVGQIFARNTQLNNFFDNWGFDTHYVYYYSPTLTFDFFDVLKRSGKTRTTGVESGQPVPPGLLSDPLPGSFRAGDFLSTGATLRNNLALQGRYLYSPNVTIGGGYNFGHTIFSDIGGNDSAHSAGLFGAYSGFQDHSLRIGYRVTVLKARDGRSNIIHDVNLGDDFLTQRIELTPTLTLSAATGISLNTGSRGPRVANNTSVTVTKLWEDSTLNVGLRKGLTNSFGVAGPSDTTSVFGNWNIRLTEQLNGAVSVDFSNFDTDDTDFRTLQGQAALQYWFNTWLSSNLSYRHQWRSAGQGASGTLLGTSGTVRSNSILAGLSIYFDIWPNIGLAQTAPITRIPQLRSP